MPLLPTSLGTRPRLAVEIRSEGVVAARSDEGSSLLASVDQVELRPGIVLPQLGAAAHGERLNSPSEAAHARLSSAERSLLTAALRSVLESVGARGRQTTLIVPDSTVRVLLLDFDALPAKNAEALPVVRFRLKKLVPFDVDTAAVSYQVLSSDRTGIRVLAVAMPGDLLAEYEGLLRDAGFEPGAVLPSTLAALPGLAAGDAAALVVNAGRHWVTTAIVRGDSLLLHRSMELGSERAQRQPMGVADPIEAEARIQAHELERELTALDRGGESAWEIGQAVSVAAAYYEDTIGTPPTALISAGTLSARDLSELLDDAGVGPFPVHELTSRAILAPDGASASRIPLGWLAGVRGALV